MWDHEADGFSRGIGENIAKMRTICLRDNHSPESVGQVDLSEIDGFHFWHLANKVQKTEEDLS
eukprot:scaffold86391_cov52-Attheya_sp.AAC.1